MLTHILAYFFSTINWDQYRAVYKPNQQINVSGSYSIDGDTFGLGRVWFKPVSSGVPVSTNLNVASTSFSSELSFANSGDYYIWAEIVSSEGKKGYSSTNTVKVREDKAFMEIQQPSSSSVTTTDTSYTISGYAYSYYEDIKRVDMSTDGEITYSLLSFGSNWSKTINYVSGVTQTVIVLKAEAMSGKSTTFTPIIINWEDAQGPNVSITSPANGANPAPDFTVYGVATDTQSENLSVTLYVSNQSTAQVTSYTPAIDGLGNFSQSLTGFDPVNYSIWVEAEDDSGNISTDLITVTPLSEVPVVNVSQPSGATIANTGSTYSIQGTANVAYGSIANVYLAFRGSTYLANGTDSWTYNLNFADGEYSTPVSIYTLSDSGNSSITQSITINWEDNVNPDVAILSPLDNATPDPEFTVQAGASDAYSGIQNVFLYLSNHNTAIVDSFVMSSNGVSNYTQLLTLDAVVYSLFAVAKDKAGNTATNMITITPLSEIPVVNVTQPLGSSVISTTPSYTLMGTSSVEYGSVNNVYISYRSATYAKSDSDNWSYELKFVQGEYSTPVSIYAITVDANTSETQNVIINWEDNTAPTANITYPSEGNTIGQDFNITGVGNDDFSGLSQLQLFISNKSTGVVDSVINLPIATTNFSTEITGLAVDNYGIWLRALDQANNETWDSVNVTVSAGMPTITKTSPTFSGSSYSSSTSSVIFSGTTSIPVGNITNVYLLLNGSRTQEFPTSNNWNFTINYDNNSVNTVQFICQSDTDKQNSTGEFNINWEDSPQCNITTSGPVSASTTSVNITGTASANVGTISSVQYKIGAGGTWVAAVGTTSWNFDVSYANSSSTTVYVKSINTAGEETTEQSIIINWDDTPQCNITTSSPVSSSSSPVTISGTASVNVGSISSVQYKIGTAGSWTTATGTGSWNFDISYANAGTTTVYVKAVTSAGQSTTEKSININWNDTPQIDVTSPTTVSDATSSVTVQGTASVPLGSINGVQYKIGTGGTWTSASGTSSWSVNFDYSGSSAITVYFRVLSSGGDIVEASESVSISWDTTPVLTATSTHTSTSPTTTISGTASVPNGSISSVQYSRDNGNTWNNVTGTTSWSFNLGYTVGGSFTETVKVRVIANGETVTKDIALTWDDNTAPSHTVTKPVNNSHVLEKDGLPMNISVSDGFSGPAWIRIVRYDASWTSIVNSTSRLASSMDETWAYTPGTFYFKIYGEDNANNTGTPSQITVTVHDSEPAINITSPSSAANFDKRTITVSGTASVYSGYSMSSIQIDVNGTIYSVTPSTSWSKEIYLDDVGNNIIEVTLTAEDGNTATDTITVTRDEWCKYYLTDGTTGDEFGYDVAVSDDGNVMAITSPKKGTVGELIVLRWDGHDWVQYDLSPSDGLSGDKFGYSVDVDEDGSVVVVGSPYYDDTATDSGKIYVYTWNGTSYSEQSLSTSQSGDAAISMNFGWDVSIDDAGQKIVVGAPNFNTDNNSWADNGLAEYYRNTGSWTYQGNYTEYAPPETGNHYGYSVSLSGDGLKSAVGAIDNGSGAVYIYEWSASSGTKISSPSAYHTFGYEVEFDDNGQYLIIGGPNEGNWAGNMYVYSSNAVQQGYYDILESYDYKFGKSVSISGDHLWFITGGPDTSTGKVAMTQWGDSGPEFNGDIISITSLSLNDKFGQSVSLSQDASVILIGAPAASGITTDSGVIYYKK